MDNKEITSLIGKIREEIQKAGEATLFNLRLNFFANYSAVI
jgi:hypothetical protein